MLALLKNRILSTLTCLLLSSIAWGQNAQSGDLLEVPVEFGENNINLRFRYVAPGVISVNEPWLDSSDDELYRSSGFYVMETELSIADVEKVLGANGLKHPATKFNQQVEVDPKNNTWDYFVKAFETKSSEVPLVGIAIKDLALFCDALSKASTTQNLANITIEGRTIRPLTTSEWRLAAIGKLSSKASNNYILLPNYPEPEKVPDGLRRRFEAAYKALKIGGEFTGSIEDIYKVISGTFERDIQVQVDEAFRMLACESILKQVEPNELKNPQPTSAVKLKFSNPNSLGIFDLMNGLPEWTLIEKTESEAISSWESFISSMLNNPEAANRHPTQFSLVGGSFARPFTSESVGFWKTSTIWGGPKIGTDGRLKIYGSGEFDHRSFDSLAGIRLGVFRSLRKDWFEVVRNAHFDQFDTVDRPRQVFGSFEETLSQLSTEEEVGRISLSVINFYKSLAYYSLKESRLTAESLGRLDFPEVTPPPKALSDAEKEKIKKQLLLGLGGTSNGGIFQKKKDKYVATTPAGENGLFGDILIEFTRLDNELVKGKTVPIERALTKTE